MSELASIELSRGAAMISSENGLLLATVLLNVQGRDVGSFVEEARATVARGVALPPGYYIDWSGRYENQERARQRLQVVLPIVLLVIFVLLYFTYHSVVEAAHVLLAVPFALSGGVYLLWLLGYNFSVAVWVGFIALFGTAVQTGVVMVIYLEEAVERKAEKLGGALTRTSLREAVMEGALLRLRPKVMTVSTVVAALMPIMWSTRVGAEVMKPLATPVLGGMVSSLVHVLIVTPVIFYWLRARHLPADEAEPSARPVVLPAERVHSRRSRKMVVGGALAVLTIVGALYLSRGRGPTGAEEVIQRMQSGNLDVLVISPSGALNQGRSAFVIEFRDATSGELVDVGTVRGGGAMTMPGMAMSSAVQVRPSGTPGRYDAVGEFAMAGAWQMTLEWEGPAGSGSVAFEGMVQ